MLLWKLDPFIWFVFVDNEIGPPTSIGESDLDGVGLAVEFWFLIRNNCLISDGLAGNF